MSDTQPSAAETAPNEPTTTTDNVTGAESSSSDSTPDSGATTTTTTTTSDVRQMPASMFYAMRIDEHVRMTVHDSTDKADELIRGSLLLKTIVNQHFETELALRKRRKGAKNFTTPLIVYSAQSTARIWSSLKPLALDDPHEAALISPQTRASAEESAAAGAMAFILIVDSIERLSHDTVARCVCSVRVYYDTKGGRGARNAKTFAKRIKALNKITHLSVQRVSTRCEDMPSKATLMRAREACRVFRRDHPKFKPAENNNDDDDDGDGVCVNDEEWLRLQEEELAAAREKAVSDINLDTGMQLYAKQSLALQSHEAVRRVNWLMNQVLLESTAFDRVEAHIRESAKSGNRLPLLISFHTRNGCPLYGTNSYKFSTYEIFKANIEEGAPLADAEELKHNMRLLAECAATGDKKAGPDALMALVSDEGFGPLFGIVSRSNFYMPNIMGQRDSIAKQQRLIDEDRANMTQLEHTMHTHPLKNAALPSDSKQSENRALYGKELQDEYTRISDEHAARIAALNADYNSQIDELNAKKKHNNKK